MAHTDTLGNVRWNPIFRETSTSVPPVAKSSYLVKDQDFSGIRTSPWGMRSGEPANGPSSVYLKFNTILCPYSLHMNLESGMYGKRSALWELWMWSSTWQLRCVCQGFHPDSQQAIRMTKPDPSGHGAGTRYYLQASQLHAVGLEQAQVNLVAPARGFYSSKH